jgi:hypothetical protein|tara:strand:+ start:968 stop:1189 length:222 start_codon:yes stop_codon:yes gene_type:complete
MKDEFPKQRQFIFQENASPETEKEWLEEQGDYESTVKTVLITVVLGAFFQFFTFGMMILAFWIIDTGLNNPLN